LSFARGVPNPISVVIKDISYACWRLSLIANPVATIVVNAVIGVVVVLTVVVVIWRVIVVIRTVVVVVLTIVVIEGRVFPATYLGKAAARDKEGANKKQSFHFLPTFH
jgi:ABC-type multidrug transport system fused ATPase/permease subunit